MPRIVRRPPRFLTSSQVGDLAQAVPEQYGTLVYLLAYGGLRWAEAVGLKVNRVNLLRRRIEIAEALSEAAGKFHVVPSKTWETRAIEVPSFVADGLGHHIGRFTDVGPESLVFTASGTPIRASNFRRTVWYPAVEHIGEEELRIHDLRHTCASMLIAAGAHPGLGREHLGHSSIRVTMDV